MIYSLLDKALEAKDTLSLIDLLKSLGITVFDPIFKAYGHDERKPYHIVLFILYAYSEESPLVILRRDSRAEAEAIVELLNIPTYISDTLVDLQDKVILQAIVDYVELFQTMLWRTLTQMKIQYANSQRALTMDSIVKDDGTTDYKERIAVTKSLEQLSKTIDKIESELKVRKNEQFRNIVKTDYKHTLTKTKQGGIEDSSQIK